MARGRTIHLAGLVDDHVVVVLRARQLDGRVPLPHFELVGRLRGPRAQPPEERLERGRHEEDQERVRDAGLDGSGALHVDLEDGVLPGLQRIEHLATGCPVPVAMDLGHSSSSPASRSATNSASDRK